MNWKRFVNLTQLAARAQLLKVNVVSLWNNFSTFVADCYYASINKKSPRSHLVDKLVGVTDFISFAQRYHLIIYYPFLAMFLMDIGTWQFYFAIIIITEFWIVFIGCFWRLVWVARFILFGFLNGVYFKTHILGQEAGHAALSHLHKWSGVSELRWWYDLYDSSMALDNIICYFQYYFLTLFLPFFCEALILFMPLISAIVLFSAGHLIGYVFAGYFASGAIFISAVSSYYIWFFYPKYRAEFLHMFGNGSKDWIIQPSAIAPNSIDILPRHPREIELIDPFSIPAFIDMKEAKHLNLWMDFGNFIRAPFFRADLLFVIDSISIIMVSTITTISLVVHLYSIVYMKSDPHSVRFFALLSLFTFFMIVLVMAGNLIILYIGWEGVGLSSFLLISFWYTRVQAQKAAMKAILVNKIGDMFLIFAAALITFFTSGSTTIISAIFCATPRAMNFDFLCVKALDVIAISLVIAAFVKSAQIFFHTWLADAMEGPTPVSALLHAATMVTAGVYLVIRFSPLLEYSSIARGLIFFGGFFTIILSSLIALTQFDIKKIIAYSTCSQLGLMFFACGLSAYDFALFHFFNHAFFKCLLFLLAGVIIHQLKNEQDIRRMGGLGAKMPVTHVCFLIATMSLIGMPGFSGAVSKDMIFHLVNLTAGHTNAWIVKLFLFFTNIIVYLTVAYAARLYYYLFWGPVNYNKSYFTTNYRDVAFQEKIYAVIFFFLALMSILGGRLFKSFFVNNYGLDYVNIHNEIVIRNPYHDLVSYDSNYRYIVFFLTAHAIFLVLYGIHYLITNKIIWFLPHNAKLYELFIFFNKKCYFDDVYNSLLVRPFLKLSYVFRYAVEDGIFKSALELIWLLLVFPARLKLYRARLNIMHHFLFTSAGLFVLLWGGYILSL